MKIWKAILATLVIFAAGMFAGGLVAKRVIGQKPPPIPAPPVDMQQRFYGKLKKELALTADQTNRLDKIFVEGNARVKIIWDLMAPELQKERDEVFENIRAVLTPEQREKFEKLAKERPRKPDGDGRRGPKPGETNRSKEPRPAARRRPDAERRSLTWRVWFLFDTAETGRAQRFDVEGVTLRPSRLGGAESAFP